MISVTGTLTTAITSWARQVWWRVLVDWNRDAVFTGTYDDLTAVTASLTIDRSLTTDLPEDARIVTGGGAAEATIEVAGSFPNGTRASYALSPYSTTLGGSLRLGAPVDIDHALTTSAGIEYVNGFTGRVRRIDVNPVTRSATINALDGRESLRTLVTLPSFPAHYPAPGLQPGLNAGWVIEHILWRNGYYAQPPTRAGGLGVALHAHLNGSTWPVVGSVTGSYVYGGAPGYTGAPKYQHLRHGLGLTVAQNTNVLWGFGANTLSNNSGSNVFVEFNDLYVGASNGVFTPLVYVMDATDSIGYSITLDAAGTITVKQTRGTFPYPTGSVSLGSFSFAAVHYLGVHIVSTTAGATVHVKIDGTETTGTLTCAGSTGNPALTQAYVRPPNNNTPIMSGLQVTSEAYASTMYNNAFVPTAVLNDSLNELTGMPPVDTEDPWSLLQELASAEQGIVLFDEGGVARFYNRTYMSGGSAVASITAATSLKALATSEAVDTVRNVVKTTATPLDPDPADALIWELSEAITIPGFGTVTLWADAGATIYGFSTFAYLSGGTAVANGSGYRAALLADGTGGDISNLTTVVTIYPSRVSLAISNPNGNAVFLVDNSLGGANAGQPMVHLVGRLLRPQAIGAYTALARDATSITNYGEHVLEVGSGNRWSQSTGTVDALATALLAALKDPHPILTGVDIVPDPRLQLADRVTVTDTDGLNLNADFWITGIRTTVAAGQVSQQVTLRQV